MISSKHFPGLWILKCSTLAYSTGNKGGRPPFDPVLMFRTLDVTLMAAPKQCKTNAEKADLRAGRIPADWQGKSAKLSHKDRHARWTLKFAKAEQQDDGSMPSRSLTTSRTSPSTGSFVSSGSGRQRLSPPVMARCWERDCWIKPMKALWRKRALSQRFTGKSRISSPYPSISSGPIPGKSVIRSRVEHVFADQKSQTRLLVRTVSITQAP